jgi:thymidylate synthase ThyX
MVEGKNPYINRVGDRLEITDKGKDYLDRIVTDSSGPVYAFRGEASPLLTAAAMARLSRRGSDLRVIYLDEFAMAGDEDASGLIHRVVTAYGDDSVQQLAGLHFAVEDASNLMTKKLEWGRFGSYLEQSTRYIFFDQKDADGKYKYFVPENLDSPIKKSYCRDMDQIFELYSEMVRELTEYVRNKTGEPTNPSELAAWKGATRAQACDAIRPVLPAATKSTVGIFASVQATENLVMRLLSEDLPEARKIGQAILNEARQVMPAFFERADKPDRGGATTAYMATKKDEVHALTEKLTASEKPEQVTETTINLAEYWPENEFDVITHILFAESNLSLDALKTVADKMTDKQKKELLEAYIGKRLNRRHRPGRALEYPHYVWEVTADYGTFRDLQRHRVVDGFEWQRLTTDFGFDVPKLVEEAGLAESFKKCFKISEKLVASMVRVGLDEEAQYATLFGHRMRYKFLLNARAAFHFIELRSAPQGHPGYRHVANKMHEAIAAVHPNIAAGMQFVNKDEDPALTRMAAELATQYKLEKLGAERIEETFSEG